MSRWKRSAFVVLLVGVTVFGGVVHGAAQPAEPASDPARRAFSQAVARYADLRARLAEPLPPFGPSRSAWSTLVAKRYLASAIRTARADARPGSIFAPEVAAVFRRELGSALTAADRLVLGLSSDDEAFG